MPVERQNKPRKSRKKKGDDSTLRKIGGFLRDRAQEVEDIAVGIPTGLYMTGSAAARGDIDELRSIGRAMGTGMYNDVRHPLRNPTSTLLTALGLATLGGGAIARGAVGASTASRTGSLAKGARAAARKPQYERRVKGIQRQSNLPRRYKSSTGKMISVKPEKRGRPEYAVSASPNPIFRAARGVSIDRLYEASAKRAANVAAKPKLTKDAKILKMDTKEYADVTKGAKTHTGIVNKAKAAGYSAIERPGGNLVVVDKTKVVHTNKGRYARSVERRTTDQRRRYGKQVQAVGKEAPVPPVTSTFREASQAPMNALRLKMYANPRYYAQNLLGTSAMLAAQGPFASMRSIPQVRKLKKSDRATYDRVQGMMGESGTSSLELSNSGKGRFSRVTRKASELANKPESKMRMVAAMTAARRMGLDPSELSKVMSLPHSNRYQLLAQRANEAVGDYSRVGGTGAVGKGEAAFVRSGVPIFYPMTKAFTRYAGRFPSEHSALTALLAQQGQSGRADQLEGFGGVAPPPWSPYLIPRTPGKDTLNPQNVYPFSPGTDVARQIAQMLPGAENHPTLNLAQNVGPLLELLYGSVTGKNFQTGFEIEGVDKYGRAGGTAIESGRQLIPFAEYFRPNESKAYGIPSVEERIGLGALGPTLYPRTTDYDMLRQQGGTGNTPRKKRKRKVRRQF
jgi:hypothetical protein